MQYLFTSPALQRLRSAADPEMLCIFDFDGTLAPIVASPADVRLPAAIRDRMIALCGLGKVGILTGRSLEDIQPRLGFTPHYTVGNHGIEGVPGWQQRDQEFAATCGSWNDTLGQILHGDGDFDPAIEVENKRYSLSVHYRLTRDPQQSARQLQSAFGQLRPAPRVMPGKYVFNLLPQGAADKGSAMLQLLDATGAPGAIYVGDDVTDEDVFRLGRADILGIRTEYDAGSAAEFFLTGQHEMPRMLDELARCLAESAHGARSEI